MKDNNASLKSSFKILEEKMEKREEEMKKKMEKVDIMMQEILRRMPIPSASDSQSNQADLAQTESNEETKEDEPTGDEHKKMKIRLISK